MNIRLKIDHDLISRVVDVVNIAHVFIGWILRDKNSKSYIYKSLFLPK